jgi:aminoglycoside phosphotransferase family enzyme/predicted kinase
MGAQIADQDDIFAFLANPATYGFDQSQQNRIKRIDTHGAVVFLAGTEAHKVKRAVLFPFMDFSTLEKRRAACENEIRVNRENAPDIYLGTVPIRRTDKGLNLGGEKGDIVEWAVHTRRFDEESTLDKLASRGALDLGVAADLAESVSAAHARAPRSDLETAQRFHKWMIDTLDGLAGATVFAPDDVAALRLSFLAAYAAAVPLLERREAQGKVRRCHGDVHLRNILLENGKPILFDAIEFDDLLATIDILYDLAFVLMDFWQRGLHAHANLLFNRYLWRTPELEQELEGLAALPMFLALRAAIRARVAAALSDIADADHSAEAKSFFGAAEGFLRPEPARLVAVGGLSGTGKSTLAAALADAIGRAPGAVHLRSDIERKRLRAAGEYERLPADAYAPEVTAQVYDRLHNLAEIALSSGQSVIVDAVHAREDERGALTTLAKKLGVPFAGLWLEAPVEALVARVEARQHDASDANEAVVRQQADYSLGALDWVRLNAGQGLDVLLGRARAALNLPAG